MRVYGACMNNKMKSSVETIEGPAGKPLFVVLLAIPGIGSFRRFSTGDRREATKISNRFDGKVPQSVLLMSGWVKTA